MPYLNVNEVESALAVAAGPPNAAFTQLITLPNATWEGRTTRAIKLASGSAPDRIGVCFIGGVHAREWGSCDILIAFVERVGNAYRTGTGLVAGGKSFTAAQIASIVDNLDVVVFPQVNPDGRNHSMTVDTCWRKNRRTGQGAGVGCTGVDLNRNYDFLWDFPNHFSPAAPIRNSTTTCGPCNTDGYEVYIGPAVHSEPETRNVVWLVDNHPNVRVFVDVHSYGRKILYGWGDDQPQTLDPNMNFRNPAFDSLRGVENDATYREWIPASDQDVAIDLANRMRSAIAASHGNAYTVQTSFALYPTAGTSTDYMFSRHVVDPSKGKVRSFTIEWGTAFQPAYNPTMVGIIDEVVAGLVELCLGVLATHADVHIRDNASDTGAQPASGAFWESPDLVVRQSDDGVFADQPARRGQPNYLYVRVTNRGPATARFVRVSARGVRFAGTEFVFPQDWRNADATHLVPTPIVDTFTNVPPGSSRVAKFRFSAAQVNALWDWQQASFHPCLLAEADGSNDFRPPAGTHVWENNNLGQRNISIVNVAATRSASFRFRVGNAANLKRSVELVVDRRELPKEAELLLDLAPPPLRAHWDTPGRTTGPSDDDRSPVLACSGAAPQRRQGRQVVAVLAPQAVIALARAPGELRELALYVRPHERAKVGDVYRVRVAQRDEAGTVVGGVTAEVHVVAASPHATDREDASSPVATP